MGTCDPNEFVSDSSRRSEIKALQIWEINIMDCTTILISKVCETLNEKEQKFTNGDQA